MSLCLQSKEVLLVCSDITRDCVFQNEFQAAGYNEQEVELGQRILARHCFDGEIRLDAGLFSDVVAKDGR